MSLFMILDRRPHGTPTPLLQEVAERLERLGVPVEMGVPDEMAVPCDELEPAHDLYLLKSYSELGLSVAGVLEARGARLINSYAACVATRDKVLASRRLRAAGVPTPRTWATSDPEALAALLDHGPLVVKPARGVHGRDVSLVRDVADLRALPSGDGPLIAQQHVHGDGEDLKVYVIGLRVFAVRKRFTATSHIAPGRPCAVDDAVRRIALRCGRALGLELYGLDLVNAPTGLVVIDVNYLPGYRGITEAAPLLTRYLYARARGANEVPVRERGPARRDAVGLR